MSFDARSVLLPALGGVVLLSSAGCVRRTLSITSDPAGALVILNDREVGRTPVEVDFTYYGTYDVRLHKEGYEPFVGGAEASPPVWDTIPLDLASELIPADLHARVAWHFIMAPSQSEGLIERATEMRGAVQAIEAEAPATDVGAGAGADPGTGPSAASSPAQQPAPAGAEPAPR